MRRNIIIMNRDVISDIGIEQAVAQAYQQLFMHAAEAGLYVHRCWNFVPDIHSNYSAFNRGRRVGFEEAKYPHIPVATAVGSNDHFSLSYILGETEPKILSNPRQVESFNYPDSYGDKPLFSRAALIDGQLYIAGTASIIGHDTVHKHDVVGQTYETIRNIQAIISQTSFEMYDMTYVVYLDPSATERVVCDILTEYVPRSSFVFYPAQICRSDLLVEIEAMSR